MEEVPQKIPVSTDPIEMPKSDKGKTNWSRIFKSKLIRWIVLPLLIIFIALILFLKLDTGTAAVFTDNVLRPIIGSRNVIYLEKIFFNSSDTFDRLTSDIHPVSAPKFDPGTAVATNTAKNNLDLKPIVMDNKFKPLSGEGIWKDYPLALFPGKEAMAYTFVRSDPQRSYSITTLVQMDMSQMKLGSVAGTQQPGGPVGKPGPGVVPRDIINSGRLIAAFDGGFQYKDGQFGMIVGNTTYLPLEKNLGTLVGYNDGSLKIINYTGQNLGNDIAFVRQNCPILIENGKVEVTQPQNRKFWGRLVTGTFDIYTWRSGLGLTANGNLIFAVGNNLTPITLADALKAAGAVNAIQLDINPFWVRFNIFEPAGPGKYTSTTLNKELTDGSKEYLNGYTKDFFYVYKK